MLDRVHLKALSRCIFAMLAIAFATAVAADSKPHEEKRAEEEARRKALSVEIKRVEILDVGAIRRLLGIADCTPCNSEPAPDKAASASASGTGKSLVGPGDVVVYVDRQSYVKAKVAADLQGNSIRLYLNGFDQAGAAKLVSVENWAPDLKALRFNVTRSSENRPLWTALYADGNLQAPTPLRVSLGWSGVGSVSDYASEGGNPLEIQVSSTTKLGFAFGLLGLLVVLAIWVLVGTDAARDAPTPTFWRHAKDLQKAFRHANSQNAKRAADEQSSLEAVISTVAKQSKYSRVFVVSDAAPGGKYSLAAKTALDREASPAAFDENDAVLGLAFNVERWRPVRATYSLGRFQLGVWLLFTIGTGIFLWIVYGDLPMIPPAMLGLMGLSFATTGAAAMADSAAGGRDYEQSRGLFSDLVTGFDTKQQIHRFQSVIVNLLLLGVGISGVLTALAYPTFEPSWLGLLGISGLALAAGKQLVENPLNSAGDSTSQTSKQKSSPGEVVTSKLGGGRSLI